MKPKLKLSEDQEYCRRALSMWVCGDHHLPKVSEFGNGICINFHGDLSTFDFNRLTQLVIIAHRYCVRIEITSSGPRMVRIIAHRRSRTETSITKRHPGLTALADEACKAETWPEL